MTTETYNTKINYADHRTFGGLIHESDFNTERRIMNQRSSSIAERIMSDWKFDRQCIKDDKQRTIQKEYKKSNGDKER